MFYNPQIEEGINPHKKMKNKSFGIKQVYGNKGGFKPPQNNSHEQERL